MKPCIGDYVKIIFRNAMQAEGVVEQWSDNVSVLRSENSDNYLIIQKTIEDVMIIKIDIKQKSKEEFIDYDRETLKVNSNEAVQDLEQEVQKIKGSYVDDLKLQNLAELRKLQAIQERKIISEKLKEHHIGEVKATKYGVPRFLKK